MRHSGTRARLPVVESRGRASARTVAIRDVLDAPELNDATLGRRARADRSRRAGRARDADRVFGRVIGVLALHRADADDWTPAEISLAEAVAREAAIAIDTSRLLRESTRQAQVERGFYRIAAVLSEPLSAEATLDAVAQAAAEALGGDSAAVLRAAGDELELAGSHELAERLAAYLPGRRSCADALRASRQGARVAPAAARTAASARASRARRPRRAAARCSRCRWRSPAATASGSCSCSSRARRCSTTSSSSWPATSPAPRAARWSAASCTSASAARARWRSGSRGPAASSPASSIRTTCSTRPSATPSQLLGADGASVRAARGRRGGRPGRDRRRRGARDRRARAVDRLARRRHRPDALDACDRGRPRRTPGSSRPTRCSRPATRPTSACRWSGPRSRSTGSWPSTAPAARMARGGGRGAARARRHRGRRARRTPSSTRASATSSSAARRSSPTSPTASSPSTATGKVVLWNPAAERVTGVPPADALGRTPAQALGRPLEAGEGIARRQPPRPDPARRRGGLALAERGGDDRSRGRRRRPHLRVPRHLRRAERRADEVRLRLDRLARAAHAADLDLRLRRDAAAPGRALRRGGARDVPPLHRLRVRAPDGDRRPPALGGAARHGRHGRPARGDRRRRGRQRGGPLARGGPTARTGTASSSRSPTSRSRPRPTGTSSARCSRTCSTTRPLLARGRHGHRRRAPPRRRGRGERRGRGRSGSRTPSRSGSSASSTAATRRAGAVGAGATGLGLFLADGLVKAMGGRIWVDSDEGRGSTFVLELRAAESET